MLRFSLRRIKDTVERTSNVLEARRTWTYGNEGVGVYDGTSQPSHNQNKHFQRHWDKRPPNSIFEFGLEPEVPKVRYVVNKRKCRGNLNLPGKFTTSDKTTDSGSSSSEQEDYRERIHRKHHCKFQSHFIEALTWSSALICGWYTSQILCMRRRHLQNGWNGRCKYAKMLSQPSQAFHSTILSHWAQAAPVNSSEAYVWKFNEENNKFHSQSDFYKEKSVEPVNYEHQKSGEKISNEAKAIAPKTFDDAVQNLLHVLGDIEFQLGVASVQSDRYDLAVSHFKLATSHSHASAAFNLGICYEEGIGIEKNAKMALECYMLASSLGHAKASYNVGVFHARGLADLPKNRKAARQYFQEAAKLGLNKANKVLGRQNIAPLETVEQKIVPEVTNYQYEPIAVAV